MSNLFKQFQASLGKTEAVKSNHFFTENNVNGFITKAQFLNYIGIMTETEFKHLEKSLEYISMGFPINNILVVKIEPETGFETFWCKFRLPRAEVRLRMVHHEGILRFFESYQKGTAKFEISLRELIQEADFELKQA
jgi:hypothetical protein